MNGIRKLQSKSLFVVYLQAARHSLYIDRDKIEYLASPREYQFFFPFIYDFLSDFGFPAEELHHAKNTHRLARSDSNATVC